MKSSSLAHIYALMMMSGCFMPSMCDTSALSPIDVNELKERYDRLYKQHLFKSGCKEFHYDHRISETMWKEVTIIALNKKNADRKYDKFIKLWKESV